jgi:membrane protein DedA with SNARE-associated domain
MFHQFVAWLASTVGQWWYPGIVMLMALESSFFPFPSEVVIPPAAYLAAVGKMNIVMGILCGTLGSLIGAVFNYWLALKFGRPLFEKYGRYRWSAPGRWKQLTAFLSVTAMLAPLSAGFCRVSASTFHFRLASLE